MRKAVAVQAVLKGQLCLLDITTALTVIQQQLHQRSVHGQHTVWRAEQVRKGATGSSASGIQGDLGKQGGFHQVDTGPIATQTGFGLHQIWPSIQ